MFIVVPHIILIIAALFLIGLPSRRLGRRLKSARIRLADPTVEREVQEKFNFVLADSAKKAQATFWVGLIATIAVLYIGFQLYASSVEPGAVILQWLGLYMVFFGFALLFAALVISYAVAVYWQAYKAAKVLGEYVTKYPASPVLKEVQALVGPRVGEVGMSVTTTVIVVTCALYGLFFVAILYIATQTAIDCARSSKCM